MEIIYSKNNTNKSKYLEYFNEENALKVNNFHSSFKEYVSTPLIELKELSKVNIDSAKDALKDMLANYQGYKNCRLMVVSN